MNADEKNLEQVQAWHDEQMAKHGWFAHFVFDDVEKPNGINFHTHGLDQTYDHLDFQIVLPLQHKTAHSIFWELARMLEAGRRFSSGDRVSNVISNYDIKLVQVEDNGRNVLRIIFPDAAGHLEKEELAEKFAAQYEGV